MNISSLMDNTQDTLTFISICLVIYAYFISFPAILVLGKHMDKVFKEKNLPLPKYTGLTITAIGSRTFMYSVFLCGGKFFNYHPRFKPWIAAGVLKEARVIDYFFAWSSIYVGFLGIILIFTAIAMHHFHM